MGREYKRSKDNSAKKTDLRKKANKDERRAVKQILNNGIYEGLQTKKKFSGDQIEWND